MGHEEGGCDPFMDPSPDRDNNNRDLQGKAPFSAANALCPAERDCLKRFSQCSGDVFVSGLTIVWKWLLTLPLFVQARSGQQSLTVPAGDVSTRGACDTDNQGQCHSSVNPPDQGVSSATA